MTFRYGSVCSGVGTCALAWGPGHGGPGWETAFFSEIEPFPRAVLEQRFPGVPLHGDFTTMEGAEHGPIDLLAGGTPCQDYSIGGGRAGLDGDRGNLTLEFARLAGRTRARWLAWENVPGCFSTNSGRDFGCVLAALAGYPGDVMFEPPDIGWNRCGVVAAAGPDGYGIAWRVLDAQYFGVAQQRLRLFLVGHLGDWRPAAAVLLEPHSLRRDWAPERAEAVSVCLTARGAGSLDDRETYIVEDAGVRHMTPLEFERCQGMPDDWTRIAWRGKPPELCPDGPRYKAIGNAWAVPVARWIGRRIKMFENLGIGRVA